MIIEGKIINFLGDSITEGAGVTDIENNRYDNVLLNMCKLKAVHNYGIGGTRIANNAVASECTRFDMYFSARAHDLNPDADVIVVFGGTNDYGHGDAPFGDFNDNTPDTFCGAVEYLIKLLKELYPKAQIVFMTPARRSGDENVSANPRVHKSAKPLKAYVDAIKVIGEKNDVPVLDLYENLGINPNIQEDCEKYTTDGLHFNDAGHKIIAALLVDFLKKL